MISGVSCSSLSKTAGVKSRALLRWPSAMGMRRSSLNTSLPVTGGMMGMPASYALRSNACTSSVRPQPFRGLPTARLEIRHMNHGSCLIVAGAPKSRMETDPLDDQDARWAPLGSIGCMRS